MVDYVIPEEIKDGIRIKLYNKFRKDNGQLFKSDIRTYWQECSRFVEPLYRTELNELAKKFKEGKLEISVSEPVRY